MHSLFDELNPQQDTKKKQKKSLKGKLIAKAKESGSSLRRSFRSLRGKKEKEQSESKKKSLQEVQAERQISFDPEFYIDEGEPEENHSLASEEVDPDSLSLKREEANPIESNPSKISSDTTWEADFSLAAPTQNTKDLTNKDELDHYQSDPEQDEYQKEIFLRHGDLKPNERNDSFFESDFTTPPSPNKEFEIKCSSDDSHGEDIINEAPKVPVIIEEEVGRDQFIVIDPDPFQDDPFPNIATWSPNLSERSSTSRASSVGSVEVKLHLKDNNLILEQLEVTSVHSEIQEDLPRLSDIGQPQLKIGESERQFLRVVSELDTPTPPSDKESDTSRGDSTLLRIGSLEAEFRKLDSASPKDVLAVPKRQSTLPILRKKGSKKRERPVSVDNSSLQTEPKVKTKTGSLSKAFKGFGNKLVTHRKSSSLKDLPKEIKKEEEESKSSKVLSVKPQRKSSFPLKVKKTLDEVRYKVGKSTFYSTPTSSCKPDERDSLQEKSQELSILKHIGVLQSPDLGKRHPPDQPIEGAESFGNVIHSATPVDSDRQDSEVSIFKDCLSDHDSSTIPEGDFVSVRSDDEDNFSIPRASAVILPEEDYESDATFYSLESDPNENDRIVSFSLASVSIYTLEGF